MKKREKFLIIIIIILIYLILFLFSINKSSKENEKLLINDISRLNPIYVKEIIKNNEINDLKDSILRANEQELKVAIAGKRHSQGGHAFYDDSLLLDMTNFNEILNLDNKIITVQSGITWEQIQEYVNPYNLSIKVMQSSNIFTVGGSLSSNIHGRDPSYGPIIETIESFRLLLHNGTIVNVSKSQNKELFKLVIGGYGLFGVILDVDIKLTKNLIYEKQTIMINYLEYPGFFNDNIKNKENIGLHFARMSNVLDESFLKEIYSTTYTLTNKSTNNIFILKDEKNIVRDKFFFGLSRKYDWGKKLRWYLQKKLVDNPEKIELISRNNAMRPPIKFLDYYSSKDTDILQEYFIPTEKFVMFIDELRNTIKENDINLLSVTIRYIPKNEESFISYSKKDSFSVVLYINQGLSEEEVEKAKIWTQEIVDSAIKNNGTYYLTYQLYSSQEQIRTVYPKIDDFFEKKKKYDSNELFMNKFYEKYALGIEE